MEPEVAVAWIESIRDEVTVSEACTWLGIARVIYYHWKATVETKRTDAAVEKIRELCIHHKFRYGYRKITTLLRAEQRMNHKRVQRMMQREGLQCRVRMKKRKVTGQPAACLSSRKSAEAAIPCRGAPAKARYGHHLFTVWRKDVVLL
ncbi:IS3 family transposase [Paenibacillus polymyxa]|uniref:IS3 family transposase n=1 Tax=Paenibacillus polymyxa TaxID=1406 RepID=UPI000B203ECB|nr:IS3 family transposase [Paenibacillus polymyxa]MCH6187882.1 IS3 family transposase [Paenibacillus polymyxa]MDY8092546.1 IS3 family transposase [Paenibacillus polymyxa]WRL57356.1 IS3 family transposase [Paenibacillus polymyxa]